MLYMMIVYGGAFNPPTKAHYEISSMLIEKFHPEHFVFLPVGDNYSKKGMLPFLNRFDMISIVAKKLNATVSDCENTKDYRGTYYAMKELSKKDKDIYFVMGADNFDYIEDWIEADKLVHEFNFILLTRTGFDMEQKIEAQYPDLKSHFKVVYVDIPISSTKFRETKNPDYLLDSVYEYVQKHGLYEVKKDA